MPARLTRRRLPHSDYRVVREYFGIEQWALADLLGVSLPVLKQAETGVARGRRVPLAADQRLLPLLAAVPQPAGMAPPGTTPAENPPLVPTAPRGSWPDPAPVLSAWPAAPPAPAAAPAPEALAARLDQCRQQAEQLRRRLLPLERRARQAERLLALLPTLAHPLPPANPALAPPPHPHPDRLAHLLLVLAAEARQALGPDAVAQRLLLATRRVALLHEAAALARYLPPE